MRIWACASAVILAVSCAYAENGEIVVTATKMDEAERSVPASVSVVKGHRLTGSAAVNADEMLRTVSGISVLRNYGVGSGIPGQVNVRGIPGLHGLLMLADGYNLNEAATGFLSPNEIPVIAIDRIEAVRGPFSALYGADAFSGVVNMILKEPGTGPRLSASVAAGNDGFLDLSLSSSGNAGGYSYFAAYQLVEMDNVLARDQIIDSVFNPAAGAYVDITKDAENFGYRDNRVIVKTATDVGEKGAVVVQARYFDSKLGMGQEDVRPLYPVLVDSDSETKSIFAGVEYAREISDDVAMKTRASYRDQSREVWGLDIAGFAGAFPLFAESYSKTDADEIGAGAEITVERSAEHIITAGLDARLTGADFGGLKDANTGAQFATSATDSENVENYGVFVQDSYRMDDLRLVAGIRADHHSDFGEAISPKVGIIWDVSESLVLRLAGGRAFRAPSLLELHQPSVGFGTITFVSNPDLEPEYVNSADAGMTLTPYETLSINLNVFYNDMEDVIGPQISSQIYTYENISEAWSRGIELEVQAEPAKGLLLYLSGTLQEAEDETADTKLQHIPEELAGAGVRYSLELAGCVLGLSLDGVFVGDRSYVDDSTGLWRELDSYFRTDASLEAVFAETYKLGISASNLFDEDYQESPVVNPAPGRVVAVRAGIEW